MVLVEVEGSSSAHAWLVKYVPQGLEFNTVFLVGFEEGGIPSLRGLSSEDDVLPVDLEEEKRLAYVGATRAKERLYITLSLVSKEFFKGVMWASSSNSW